MYGMNLYGKKLNGEKVKMTKGLILLPKRFEEGQSKNGHYRRSSE